MKYLSDIDVSLDGDIEIEITRFASPLIKAALDGRESRIIAFSPFKAVFENLKKGTHKTASTMYGNRYNTLTALHSLLADKKCIYMDPDFWRSVLL